MTIQQRRAFEKWMDMLAEQLNELGLTDELSLINFTFDLRFNRNIVREQIIKKLIYYLWEFESTKQLESYHLNEIIDYFTLSLGQKGIEVKFPSIEQLMFKLDKQNKLND